MRRKTKDKIKKVLFIIQFIIEILLICIITWYLIRFASYITIIFLDLINYNFTY